MRLQRKTPIMIVVSETAKLLSCVVCGVSLYLLLSTEAQALVIPPLGDNFTSTDDVFARRRVAEVSSYDATLDGLVQLNILDPLVNIEADPSASPWLIFINVPRSARDANDSLEITGSFLVSGALGWTNWTLSACENDPVSGVTGCARLGSLSGWVWDHGILTFDNPGPQGPATSLGIISADETSFSFDASIPVGSIVDISITLTCISIDICGGPEFIQFPTAAVPEPGTFALFGLGLFGLAFTRRKQTTRFQLS